MNNEIFEKKIGYEFKNKALLNTALTHSSFVENPANAVRECYERLEFIGDALVDAIIGVELYKLLSESNEGNLTKLRAVIVCERSLAKLGNQLDIPDHMNFGSSEIHSGGRAKESIIADAVEAVIGAIFLDSDYDTVNKFTVNLFRNTIKDAMAGKLHMDYKSELQEVLQSDHKAHQFNYIVDKYEGQPHDRTFYIHLEFDGIRMGEGVGKSKKEAEQRAAKATLEGGFIDNVL